ncbi:maltotransferase domain-containing protein [Pseudoroseomonas globiformis]|uniref:Alpha-1,4-glucan:maltose-1-phosphate maltosyltransferase n=1 Tax=Teichococcus globiformis TaxID=2307229 RepID=A0ABV7G5E9_9PROT
MAGQFHPDQAGLAQKDRPALPAADSATAFYHFNPLAAGPVQQWDQLFEHIAAMGFGSVVLAPPFELADAADPYLIRDPSRLHPALGGGDAVEGLRQAAVAAKARGLSLLLDLAADRMARDAPLLRNAQAWSPPAMGAPDAPPDPRQKPGSTVTAWAKLPAGQELASFWQGLLGAWAEAGIAGFRCLSPQRLDATFWSALINGLSASHPGLRFLAWTPGAPAVEAAPLAGCGFNFVAPSLPWWDFQSGWFARELATLTPIAPLLMAPEAPFAPRLSAGSGSRDLQDATALRALRFAAEAGSAWLMPMGFEYGAVHRMTGGTGEAEAFAALQQSPRRDRTAAVREANAARQALTGPTRLISSPGAPVALLRGAQRGPRQLVLANPSLRRTAIVSAAAITGALPRPGSLPPDTLSGKGSLMLGTGEVRSLQIQDVAPVKLPLRGGARAAQAATEAPRIAIEAVSPAVDNGRFVVKRTVGQPVDVTADVFTEGHGKIAVRLLWRPADETLWREVPMTHSVNDIYSASFVPERVGRYIYCIEAWVDHFAAFRDEITKKHAAGVNVSLERIEGLALVEHGAAALSGELGERLNAIVAALKQADDSGAVALFAADETRTLMTEADPRPFKLRTDPYKLDAERRAAGFASWYEIFPRSQSGDAERHGTFRDTIKALPRVREMGFDVLYFTPIHPIGQKNRKGRNNTLTPGPDDVGSPYAIGSEAGGHDALHPELGTLEDFRALVRAAAEHDLELALDFAIQCSPDHPWLKQHPDWFDWRPDGTIKYAENPPKKYEDIVNVDFYAKGATPSLWIALRDVVLFWVKEGVKLFRVDNPHTKPLPFWEWMINEVRARDPEVVFLSEAFTRPKVMYRLAKIGYSQSYTYFTWRNTAWEMREYLEELNRAPQRDFFRPHFFVNTPDINPVFLQNSGRPGHLIRAALAATLSGLWGVYNGFELCEARPLVPGKEEYIDSEKYEIKVWDYDRPGNITAEITALNRIRRENPALQTHLGTTFVQSNHDGILTYVKQTPDGSNAVLVAVSMDPHQTLETHFELPQTALGLPYGASLVAEDLMRGGEENWGGSHRHIRLDPHHNPFAIWRIRAAA